MSYWTEVRVMYDVYKGVPRKLDFSTEKRIDYTVWNHLGIEQIFNSFMDDYRRPKLEEIGSERGVEIVFKELKSCGTYCANPLNFSHNLTIHGDGILTMVGNLRDCYKDDFVRGLNEFINYMGDYYGLYIESGLVKIDGTSVKDFDYEYQKSYYNSLGE